MFDKQKKYSDAEAVLRQLIAKDPNNAIALNYLGYMLAERGERLGESVDYLKRALAIDPDNGSYLDSIGWAYFKDGKLDLALDNLKKAADQLTTNSVVQDHYGEILFKLGRYDDAIGAWTRALAGDGDSIDRGDIDKKIRSREAKAPEAMTWRASPGARRGHRDCRVCGAAPQAACRRPASPATDGADALAQALDHLPRHSHADAQKSPSAAGSTASAFAPGCKSASRSRRPHTSRRRRRLVRPIFMFAAANDDATLLLPRDRRVARTRTSRRRARSHRRRAARPGGSARGADRLPCRRRCAVDVPTSRDCAGVLFPGTSEVYLHRDRDADPVASRRRSCTAGQPSAWRAEYRDFASDLPRSIRLISTPSDRFDLRLTLSRRGNQRADLQPETFRVQIPAGTTPLTIEELRRRRAAGRIDRRKSDD